MKFKFSPYQVLLHGILVMLGGLVWVQAREIAASVPPPIPGLERGQAVEAVRLLHLEGGDETVDFSQGERDRLLLVFTTTCPACRDNQDAWKTLHEDLRDTVEVLGISLSEEEETRDYKVAHDLAFPIALPADQDRFSQAYAISVIPTTIRIGPDGKVRGSWPGGLSKAQLKEVRTAGRG